MRRLIPGVGFCLMVATTLHSIAVGNILPADVHTVCVDMNAGVVTKLADRGSWQAMGIDSLDLLDIVIGCEDAFGLRIPDGAVTRFFTLGDLVAYVTA